MRTVAVLTSGGDAPGMNPAVRAVVKLATQRGLRVLGVEMGYTGLMEGQFRDLAPKDVDAIGAAGGTVLGSSRSSRFRTEDGRAEAARQLDGIDGLVVIGGNGSLTGAHLLAQEHGVAVVGLPASIDNDIGCTSTSLGVDTALNTIVDACDRITDTARAHRRVFIVEVMGRHCGYLAMSGAVATGADASLFREQGKDENTLLQEVHDVVRHGFAPARGKQRVLILKAEGVEVSTERLAQRLQGLLEADMPGVEVRTVVLGHLVRGGRPSYRDRLVAGRLGVAAVSALEEGKSDVMVAWKPNLVGGEATYDPYVQLFALETVLKETQCLLDGSSAVTQRRVRLMENYAGVLGL